MAEEKKKHYWLHRITGGDNGWLLSYPLLHKHCLLSTGWSFLSCDAYADEIQRRGLFAIKDLYELESATWARNAYSLLHFVHDMHKNDVVVVPEGRYITIYRLTDDKILTNESIWKSYLSEVGVKKEDEGSLSKDGKGIDLGFYRRVEPLTVKILRDELGDGLYKKTRTLQTNLEITDVADEIERLIIEFSINKSTSKPGPIDYEQLINDLEHQLDEINAEEKFEDRLSEMFNVMRASMRNGIKFKGRGEDKSGLLADILIAYSDIESDIEKNIETIDSVIAAYMRGDILSSIEELKIWWDKQKMHGVPSSSINKNDVNFRTRLKDKDIKVFKEKDLFHVPFSERGTVTTKRFSIPGYPCLYLGKSIYVCWEEMKRPALSDFATSAFVAKDKINLLDLRLKKKMHSAVECENFIKMLPVILACSLKVASEKDNFKPEYILPQLLLHIIVVNNQETSKNHKANQEETQLEGIEYTSTAVIDDLEFVTMEDEESLFLADCIVLPVKINNQTTGEYCPDLINKFELTRPKYYESEYIKDSLAFIKEYISALSVSNGALVESSETSKRSYNVSYFSYMEHILRLSEFNQLDEKGSLKPKNTSK